MNVHVRRLLLLSSLEGIQMNGYWLNFLLVISNTIQRIGFGRGKPGFISIR